MHTFLTFLFKLIRGVFIQSALVVNLHFSPFVNSFVHFTLLRGVNVVTGILGIWIVIFVIQYV